MSQDEQATPTTRTDNFERSIRKPHPVYGLVRPGEKNPMGRFLDLIRSVEADAKEWKEQHENLLAMFRTSEDRAAKAERELSAARAEAERLREALEKVERWQFPPTGKFWESGTPVSYGAAYGSNGERDYMRNVARAALAATRKEEGNA